jgi:hypothetical protein
VPIGYIWHREVGLGLDPSLRVQEAVRVVFMRFRQLGSARQVLLSLASEQMHFPRPSDGKKLVSFDWTPIRYRNIIAILKNPFYAGAYAYGKSEKRAALVDGQVRTTYKHRKPFERWEAIIRDHHQGYIDWDEFERNKSFFQRTPTESRRGQARARRPSPAAGASALRRMWLSAGWLRTRGITVRRSIAASVPTRCWADHDV